MEFALKHLLKRGRSCTVVQNPDDRRFLLDLGVPADAVTIIAGSGVDTDKYQALPEPPAPVTAAFVRRMLRHKGVMTLVDAFRLVTAFGIVWLGHVTGVREVWGQAHFAVQPPRGGEGLPKSLLEAAACGRAMVATACPAAARSRLKGRRVCSCRWTSSKPWPTSWRG